MKRIWFVLLIALVMFSLPSVVSAQMTHKKVPFAVTDNVVVGTTTLKSGNYEVQCKMIDGKEFLVVTSVDKNGAEVARVPCVQEVLGEALKTTNISTMKNASGAQVLAAVRVKGEKIVHHAETT